MDEVGNATISNIMSNMPKYKSKQCQGKKTNGISESYCFMGTRQDPCGTSTFGNFVFKKTVNNNTKERLNEEISTVIQKMEKACYTILENILPTELDYFKKMKELVELPTSFDTEDPIFVQVAIGKNYMLACHINSDFFTQHCWFVLISMTPTTKKIFFNTFCSQNVRLVWSCGRAMYCYSTRTFLIAHQTLRKRICTYGVRMFH